MSQKIIVVAICLLTFLFSNQVIAPLYAATPWANDCIYIDSAGENIATVRGIVCLIENIIQPLPALIVLVALLVIIFAASKIILSGADPKAYASGMQTLLFAIIGIVLLSAAWLILVTIERFTGAEVTEFGIN